MADNTSSLLDNSCGWKSLLNIVMSFDVICDVMSYVICDHMIYDMIGYDMILLA